MLCSLNVTNVSFDSKCCRCIYRGGNFQTKISILGMSSFPIDTWENDVIPKLLYRTRILLEPHLQGKVNSCGEMLFLSTTAICTSIMHMESVWMNGSQT